MRVSRLVLLLVLALLGSSCAGGPAVPQPGWIADAADVLTAQQEAELIDLVTAFEQRTTAQLVGVTVADLGELSIEAYTRRLADAWGVGVAGVNNGVVVLLALKERQVHIEVGAGMTWQLDDARTAEIVAMMVPFFREGDYYQGFRTGFEQIIAANEGVAWDVAYYELDEVYRDGEEALGRIATFEAVITGLQEDAADVKTQGVDHARILLTDYIDPAVLFVGNRLVFYARVTEVDPLVLQLLGWEEVDAF